MTGDGKRHQALCKPNRVFARAATALFELGVRGDNQDGFERRSGWMTPGVGWREGVARP
jgi:hypothetical protein